MKGQAVKPKIIIPLEKQIQQAIIEYAWYTFRLKLYRRNTGGSVFQNKGEGRKYFVRFSEPGQADLYGYQPKTGRGVECEVKRPGNEPTDAQALWLSDCRALNVIAFWADSVEKFDAEYRYALLH